METVVLALREESSDMNMEEYSLGQKTGVMIIISSIISHIIIIIIIIIIISLFGQLAL